MKTMLKRSVKEELIKETMEKHKLTRKQAVKIVRSIEMQEEVKFQLAIDKVFRKQPK